MDLRWHAWRVNFSVSTTQRTTVDIVRQHSEDKSISVENLKWMEYIVHRGSPHCRPGFETVLQYSTMNSQNDLRSAGSQSRNYSSVAIMVSRHLILFSQSIHALFLVVADQNVNRKVKESIRLETNPHERSLSDTNQHLVYQRPYPSHALQTDSLSLKNTHLWE